MPPNQALRQSDGSFSDGFEDGGFEGWVICELPESGASDRDGNDWTVTGDAITGGYSLQVATVGDHDDNAIATKDRVVDMGRDFTLGFKWLSPDPSNRGPALRLLDAEGANFEDADPSQIYPSNSLGMGFGADAISDRGSPYKGKAGFCGNRFSRGSYAAGTVHTVEIRKEGDTATLSWDGERQLSASVRASGTYRLLIANSGTWGSSSTLLIDDVFVDYSGDTSTETPTQTATPAREGSSLRIDFQADLDAPGSMNNDRSWRLKNAVGDGSIDDRHYTWAEQQAGAPSIDLPSRTLEDTDYTADYYENVGGNFIIQQSGGYGNFASVFSFSKHPDVYPEAPYTPGRIDVRVGGNDREAQFNGRGDIELRSSDGNDVIRFEFPHDDGAGGLLVNDTVVEGDRNNGLYRVTLTGIDWGDRTCDIEVYRQTHSGYEDEPIFEREGFGFADDSAVDLDVVRMHVQRSGHVYLDNLVLAAGSGATEPATPTPAPTPTTVPPTTRRTPSTDSPTLTESPSPSAPYDLARAGYYLPVTIGDRSYRVLWDIPGADRSRRAVATSDDELVRSAVARDALITAAWAGGRRNVRWANVLDQAKRAKTRWAILETLSRAGELSSEVAATLALTSLGPAAALPTALDALDSAIVWTQDAVDSVHREQYSKMAEAGGTLVWVDDVTDGIHSASQLSREAIDLVQIGLGVAGAVDDLTDVAGVARGVAQIARTTGSVSTGLIAGGNMAASIAPQLFIGLAADYAVEAATDLFEANAKTAAAGAGHNAFRIPIIEELVGLQEQAISGALSPPGLLRYHTYQMVQYQAASAALSSMAVHQDTVDESLLGGILAHVFDSEEIARTAKATSQRYQDLANYTVGVLGAGWREGLDRYERSINAEVFDSAGGS